MPLDVKEKLEACRRPEDGARTLSLYSLNPCLLYGAAKSKMYRRIHFAV